MKVRVDDILRTGKDDIGHLGNLKKVIRDFQKLD